jgi:cysteine protease ATG4
VELFLLLQEDPYEYLLVVPFTRADDFNDLCSRSSELGEKANGAPLFTVTDTLGSSSSNKFDDSFNLEHYSECSGHAGEDEWQLL